MITTTLVLPTTACTSNISHLARTVPRAAATASSRSSNVVVRTATPTPDLGQLRRLPRQVMHRADVFPRTIENTPFWSDGCMLFLQFAPFCVSFSEQLHHGTFGSYICLAHFTYICLANHSAVSKPHPTEGAEICTRCGIFRCYKARRSVLVVVHAACAVCCSFVVLTFLFPTATFVLFLEE